MSTFLSDFSDALAAHVAQAAKATVAITLPHHLPLSAILWRKGIVVTSEQVLAEGDAYTAVLPGGAKARAKLVGRDAGTNVAAFTLDADGPAWERSPGVAVGELAVLVGADGEGGPTARLGMVRKLGPAWTSLAGGKIDRLVVLDATLRPDTEGGPVIDARGRLVGLSTSGPRGRAMVIPYETVERVLEPLLREGRVARGWLGVSVQPVALPEALRVLAGREAGLMLAGVAKDGPAEKAGLLPGDIILDLDGKPVGNAHGLSRMFGPDRIGQAVALRILRAGEIRETSVTVGARPT